MDPQTLAQSIIIQGSKILNKLDRYTKYGFVNYRDIMRFSPEQFAEFQTDFLEENKNNSMVTKGLYQCGTAEDGSRYFQDIHSGLFLVEHDNSFYFNDNLNYSKQHDIIEAAILRSTIVKELEGKSFHKIADPYQGTHGLSLRNIFLTGIPEYTVDTSNELSNLISDIKRVVCGNRYCSKIWFRGQTCEYSYNVPSILYTVPSLAPSAGRISQNDFKRKCEETLYWNTAFRIWLISQTPGLPESFKIGGEHYKELLHNIGTPLAKLLMQDPYDLYDVKDYLFERDVKPITSEILTTQQYGGSASMLDITDDLDVALFFTQSGLNREMGKYELYTPTDDRVIYLFAQNINSGTIDLGLTVFDTMPFYDSYSLPPRLKNQKCGLLLGADFFARNTYAYRIIAKIHLKGTAINTSKSVSEMFPDQSEDSLFETFSYVKDKLPGLYG